MVASVCLSESGPACQLPSSGDAAGGSEVGASEVAGGSGVAEVLARSSGDAVAGVESSELQPTNSIEAAATTTAADRQPRRLAQATDQFLITVLDMTIHLLCWGISGGGVAIAAGR